MLEKIAAFADCFLIIEKLSGLIAGYACMYANDMDRCEAYITLICIKRDHQGQHLGSALMKTMFESAVKKGMRTIRLEALEKDTGAISFYKHMGFSISEKTGHGTYYISASLSEAA